MDKALDYAKAWGLSDLRPITTTATSRVFAATWNEEPVVLKVFTNAGVRDETSSAIALRCFDGRGAVHLLRSDSQAQLLEYAEGPDLKSVVEAGHDPEATYIIADLLHRLHCSSAGHGPDGLIPLKTWFRSLFKRAENEGAEPFYKRASKVAERLLARSENEGILHGDVHHENVRSSKRGWVAIDPKGLYGERTFDATNVLCNPQGMDDFVANEARLLKNAEVLARGLKVDVDRLLAFTFAYAGLSASWSLEDRQDPSLALRMLRVLAPHAEKWMSVQS